jgi:hypothetical protein
MNAYYLVVFTAGLILGAGAGIWLQLHGKLDAFEARLHARLDTLEAAVKKIDPKA